MMSWMGPNPIYETSKHLQNIKKVDLKYAKKLCFFYLTNGTHLMVTDKTTATMPRPQHKACISFGFFSQVHVAMWQFGSTTSTLTILDKKSLVDPAAPTAIASHTDKSGTRPLMCNDKEMVSRTWDSLESRIPLSTLTLQKCGMEGQSLQVSDPDLTFGYSHQVPRADWCIANLQGHLLDSLVFDMFLQQL